MNALEKRHFVTVEEYLAEEENSPSKHEYLAGEVHAMAGGRAVHNDIAGNAFFHLRGKLAGKPCRPYNSDMKIRITRERETTFYYPDLSVTCQPPSPDAIYLDHPVVVIEVLSSSTRRLDLFEKRLHNYLSLPSLQHYLMVETGRACVIAMNRRSDRAEDFERVIHEGLDAAIPLSGIDSQLPLRELYENTAVN